MTTPSAHGILAVLAEPALRDDLDRVAAAAGVKDAGVDGSGVAAAGGVTAAGAAVGAVAGGGGTFGVAGRDFFFIGTATGGAAPSAPSALAAGPLRRSSIVLPVPVSIIRVFSGETSCARTTWGVSRKTIS